MMIGRLLMVTRWCLECVLVLIFMSSIFQMLTKFHFSV